MAWPCSSAKPQVHPVEHNCDVSRFSRFRAVQNPRIWEKFGNGVTWLRVVKGLLSRVGNLDVLFVLASVNILYNHGDHLVFMSLSVRVPHFRVSSRVRFLETTYLRLMRFYITFITFSYSLHCAISFPIRSSYARKYVVVRTHQ